MKISKHYLLIICLFSTFLIGCQTNSTNSLSRYGNITQVMALEEKPANEIAIIPRSAWTNEGPMMFDVQPMASIYRMTIHHTAMPDDDESDLGGSTKLRLQKILFVHKHKQNWADIGYHYIIDQSGRIWEGRNIKYQGAHAKGLNNLGNIGIALIGNFETHYPTEIQKKALVNFVHYLKEKYNIKSSDVYPHEHFRGTKCPGKHLIPFVEKIHNGL